MNFTLTRTSCDENGVFGTLTSDDGSFTCVVAEHAYLQDDGSYAPKTVLGTYTCVKGLHTLEHHPVPFEAFEVTNVPDHTNILLHIGNYPQTDSDGCLLVGQEQINNMVTSSKITFDSFMDYLAGTDSFTLTIVGS